MRLRLLAVNVGLPSTIGIVDGQPVLSSIAKRPLDGEEVMVGAENIAGDGQADLTVHGGADKAVYAYPVEHWPWWEHERALACGPGTFGENLLLQGADEGDVAIGDRFRWGDVLLEVSQPRAPCYKFAIHTGRSDAPQWMTVSGRCGWYLRVLSPGVAPLKSAELVRVEESSGPTVREAFAAAFHPRMSRETIMRMRETPALAEAWRRALARRLAPIGNP